ncbi:hypothetical protein [Pseudooctadecabacter jejudonensis]|uniref:Uncharacterized protein n=1 Tax=Pseudooctadecabacter jejudonensis TaxID=1391910 RepID=A0A1Y5R8A7_9RHOB|nr:hypothetical protein [Pseudooctadecabacter jejudonensis]SLN10783.1 hypothetical protein PSJ8397_00044 [Pseudooctadecabacter jejudonensis]
MTELPFLTYLQAGGENTLGFYGEGFQDMVKNGEVPFFGAPVAQPNSSTKQFFFIEAVMLSCARNITSELAEPYGTQLARAVQIVETNTDVIIDAIKLVDTGAEAWVEIIEDEVGGRLKVFPRNDTRVQLFLSTFPPEANPEKPVMIDVTSIINHAKSVANDFGLTKPDLDIAKRA